MSSPPADVGLEPVEPAMMPALHPTRRRRGRPLEMSAETLLQRIRAGATSGLLYRVHLAEPALYARARRLFGSWARALAAAGLDHAAVVSAARRRAHEKRRRPGG
jgi:hypothetical protein